MKTSDKCALAAAATILFGVLMFGASVEVSPWFSIPTGLCAAATIRLAGKAASASRALPSSCSRAAYLPDAEREIDAMGLNGPALRAAERPTTDEDRLKANALAPVPPKPAGYVMAGRVFPAPEDPGWHASGDSFFYGGARGIHVYSGSTLHTVDIACVNVAKGKDAMLYAKEIKAAQVARALATLPLAPSEEERA